MKTLSLAIIVKGAKRTCKVILPLYIPFVIYATPLYRERHPDIISRIESSVNNPFMSDDLPHLMLDLAGIDAPLFNPSKSPINPLYDKTRKRLIGYDVKYDYDEICGKK